MQKQQREPPVPFCVLRLVLDTGERLPCLVDRETWLPARVATRWAMRYRRYRVQSSTLADNLRILGLLYTWARTSGGFELDDHLTAGKIRMGVRPSERMEPLEEQEIVSIRQTIGPMREGEGSWVFPRSVFAEHTRLRNWLMFEMALELGVRRGELLKLRLDSLPRGSDDGIRILRHPDDPADSRTNEPAVKTAERVIPASRALLSALRAYMTLPPPLGRVRGKSLYLFVTEKGSPLSLDRADDVIQDISRHSGITPLSWHRLRHTWSERWAERLLSLPNGKDVLQYLGGWANPHSPDRYIQHTVAQQAGELVRAYQQTLYVVEA